MKKSTRFMLILGVILGELLPVQSQDNYTRITEYLETYNFETREVPQIPARGEKIRVILDTDAKAEVDDLWALALALLSPERFEIQGIIGATFITGGPASPAMSRKAVDTLVKLAGRQGEFPVLEGSQPMAYPYAPSESEGVDFIIRKAMESSPEDPLWVVGLGAATDMASAFLKEPRIADRVRVFWHLRTAWPDKASNFNVFGDIHAARLLFHSPLSFVLFDTGTHLSCPMEESEKKVGSRGPLGRYLHSYRTGSEGLYGTESFQEWLIQGMMKDTKGFFDLGDIAALLDPDIARWEIVDCPDVGHDVTYHFNQARGKILRCYDIDRDSTFELLYQKLENYHARQ
jgi:inosine-uridine nucleoside N-ribohydrolase